MSMITCPSCQGFVPANVPCCPNCDARVEARPPTRLGKAATAASCGAMMMTLMACYGVGPWGPDDPSTPDGACYQVETIGGYSGSDSVSGDTRDGTYGLQGSCVGGSGAKEQIFRYSASSYSGRAGVLTVSWTASVALGVYVKEDCESSAELACQAAAKSGSFTVAIDYLSDLYIVVDGASSSTSGSFQLSVSFDPQECGDGVLDPTEGCDDGNYDNGDGCTTYCEPELCGGGSELQLGNNFGSTVDGTAYFKPDCFAASGPEKIFSYTPPSYGTLQLRLDSAAGADLSLYVSRTCSASSLVETGDIVGGSSCADEPGDTELLSVPVGPEPQRIVVDSAAGGGQFNLQAAFVPACGDGEIQAWAGESCDDGNTADGDGCSSSCVQDAAFHCDSALPIQVGVLSGDTTEGSNVSGGAGCGGPEQLYSFTAPENGTATFILSSYADLSLKVMSSCATQLAGGACLNEQLGGVPEVASKFILAGDTVVVAVDSKSPADAGAYDLDLAFTPSSIEPPPPGTCAHDLCTVGDALDPACDPCVAQISAADSYCTQTAWDEACVAQVTSVCGLSC